VLTAAVCYLSPHRSQVYHLIHMASDPICCLHSMQAAKFAGLREAETKGHKHIILGDLNIRIGRQLVG